MQSAQKCEGNVRTSGGVVGVDKVHVCENELKIDMTGGKKKKEEEAGEEYEHSEVSLMPYL